MRQTNLISAYLAALITMLVWGTTFVSSKILLRSFTPVEILLMRFLLGYAALWLVYPHRIRFGKPHEELLFIAAGLCGITLYYLLENTALEFKLAANVGVIISVAPLFTALLANAFLKEERLNISFFAGFITALSGVVFITLNGSLALKLNPLGDLLALIAAAVWAVYSILMKKISVSHQGTIAITRKVFFYGILFMFPAAVSLGFHPAIIKITEAQNLFNLLFLGLGASAMCFVTWNFAVSRLGAMKTSVSIYLVPLITLTASALVLHEQITPMAIAGAILTIVGLFLSEHKNLKRRKANDK